MVCSKATQPKVLKISTNCLWGSLLCTNKDFKHGLGSTSKHSWSPTEPACTGDVVFLRAEVRESPQPPTFYLLGASGSPGLNMASGATRCGREGHVCHRVEPRILQRPAMGLGVDR